MSLQRFSALHGFGRDGETVFGLLHLDGSCAAVVCVCVCVCVCV